MNPAVRQLLPALGHHGPAGAQEVVEGSDLGVVEPRRHPEADVGAGWFICGPASLGLVVMSITVDGVAGMRPAVRQPEDGSSDGNDR